MALPAQLLNSINTDASAAGLVAAATNPVSAPPPAQIPTLGVGVGASSLTSAMGPPPAGPVQRKDQCQQFFKPFTTWVSSLVADGAKWMAPVGDFLSRAVRKIARDLEGRPSF